MTDYQKLVRIAARLRDVRFDDWYEENGRIYAEICGMRFYLSKNPIDFQGYATLGEDETPQAVDLRQPYDAGDITLQVVDAETEVTAEWYHGPCKDLDEIYAGFLKWRPPRRKRRDEEHIAAAKEKLDKILAGS